MGNKPLRKCGGNKAQLVYEGVREISEAAEEWLGKGVLTDAANVDSDLRLPVNVHELLNTKKCKAFARLPPPDDLSEGSSGGAHRSDRAMASASGPFHVGLVSEGEGLLTECRPVEVLVDDTATGYGEEEARHVAGLVKRVSSERSEFVVTIYIELAGVGFKRSRSPFSDERYVEENVRRTLTQEVDGPPLDLALFAQNYGNCVVEKVFCGGALSLRFRRASTRGGGGGPSTGGSECHRDLHAIQINGQAFQIGTLQRGGPRLVLGDEGSKEAFTVEQLEKQVKQWCKSFEVYNKNIGHPVRLKLSAFSKVEGLTAPPALSRMDFRRLALWDTAKKDLRHASNTRRLDDLRAAVACAHDADLEDVSLGPLQDILRDLEAAVEALQQASKQRDIAALQRAIKQSEDAGLPEWDGSTHDEAAQLLATLQSQWHASRLKAVAEVDEPPLEDLVERLVAAFEEGYYKLEEFEKAQAKLLVAILGLTKQAKADELRHERAQAYSEFFGIVPDAMPLAETNVAASRFSEAVREMEQRAGDRMVWEGQSSRASSGRRCRAHRPR